MEGKMEDLKDFPKPRKPIISLPKPKTPIKEKALPPVDETPEPPPTEPPKEEE